MTNVNLIFVITLIVSMVYFGNGCVLCKKNSNQQKTQIIDHPKNQVKIESSKTWSQLLKNKPKEMQIKQEEFKKAMRKISTHQK